MNSGKWALLAFLLVAGAAVYVVAYVHQSQILAVDMYQIAHVYERYVRDHEGQCPNVVADLTGDRYFKPVRTSNGIAYVEAEACGADGYALYPGRVVHNLHDFELARCKTVRGLEIRDGRVFKRGDRREILLISCARWDLVESARQHTRKIVAQAMAVEGDWHTESEDKEGDS